MMMRVKLYIYRTEEEKAIIKLAYDFEIWAIEHNCPATNPWYEEIKAMGLWEALNEAVELAYN